MADPRIFSKANDPKDNQNFIKIFKKGCSFRPDLIKRVEQLAKFNSCSAWLIQETTIPDSLILESASLVEDHNGLKWVFESKRLVYTSNGWKIAQGNENICLTSANLFEDLITFLKNNRKEYPIENLLSPTKDQQMKGNINLPRSIAATLICPYSNNWIKEPYTLKQGNLAGLTIDNSSINVALKELNTNPKNLYTHLSFIENYSLKNIINNIFIISEALQNRDWEKVERFLEDPIDLEMMQEAILNSKGQSYEKESLVKCMQKSKSIEKDFLSNVLLTKPMTEKNLTPNAGLQLFMDAYKKYKNTVGKHLEEKKLSSPQMP